MNIRQAVITVLLTVVSVASAGQANLAGEAAKNIQGLEAVESRTYNESSLYGYIDGGAELYLEYGFDTLVVTELAYDGRDIKIEAYRMKDPEAAFGIFSVSRFRCNGGAALTRYICRSAYQLQFCKGPFYVSIINDTGSEADQKTSGDIAAKMIEDIAEPPFDPGCFFSEGVDEETMKGAVLVRGPLGIYNGIPTLSDQLGNAGDFSALMIRKGQDTIASVKFNSDQSAEIFLRNSKLSTTAVSHPLSSDSTVSVNSTRHIIITF
jgi:hypothetical protein